MLKFGIILLLAAGLCPAAVIFTDPIFVSGGGVAFEEFHGGVGDSAFQVDFQSVGTIVPLSMSYGFFAPTLLRPSPGRNGFSSPAAPIGLPAAILGGDSSPFYEYSIRPPGSGGYLRLRDGGGGLIAEAPIVGFYQIELINEQIFPDGFLRQYGISISPTAPQGVPEPSGFIYLTTALGIGLFPLRKRIIRRF